MSPIIFISCSLSSSNLFYLHVGWICGLLLISRIWKRKKAVFHYNAIFCLTSGLSSESYWLGELSGCIGEALVIIRNHESLSCFQLGASNNRGTPLRKKMLLGTRVSLEIKASYLGDISAVYWIPWLVLWDFQQEANPAEMFTYPTEYMII